MAEHSFENIIISDTNWSEREKLLFILPRGNVYWSGVERRVGGMRQQQKCQCELSLIYVVELNCT